MLWYATGQQKVKHQRYKNEPNGSDKQKAHLILLPNFFPPGWIALLIHTSASTAANSIKISPSLGQDKLVRLNH
jgi:hypothetical protein